MANKQELQVLVVDRDEATKVELKDFLAAEGHHAYSVADPEQVIGVVKQGRCQMVMLDVSPPADPAVELLEKIRAADSDLCVVCMTAAPSSDIAVRTLKKQAFDYLEKPLAPEELRAVIQEAIREKGLLVDLESRLNQEVGRRLRGQRTSSGLTLKQVANRSGLSVSLISQIELGKSAASMSTLHKLATALLVRMNYFFDAI